MFCGLDSESISDLGLAGNLESWDATGLDADLKFNLKIFETSIEKVGEFPNQLL